MTAIFNYLTATAPLPQYLPYARFLLDTDLSHTAKLLYTLLLDRATLSQKNNWVDEHGFVYVIFPLSSLSEALRCSSMSICRVAGGTGSSLRQRKTERSRWGTPCCTYRCRMWIFAGCVRVDAPYFCFAFNPLTHGSQPHSTEECRSFFPKNKLPRNPSLCVRISGKLSKKMKDRK